MKKRILNIIPNTNLAGTERASLRFMQGLQKYGYIFHVFSLNRAGELKDILEENNISLSDYNYHGFSGVLDYFPLKREIKSIIKSFRPDVIMQTSHNYVVSKIIAEIPIPKILCVHFHHKKAKSAIAWNFIYSLVDQHFNYITFPSLFIKKEADAFVSQKEKLVLLRNPLPLQDVTELEAKINARNILQIPENALVIGNSSQLIKRKRLDIFIDVASVLVKKNENYYFVICGDGPEQKKLKQMVHNKKLDNRFKWLGWLRETNLFYKSIDVMLFNSDWDAFPTSPLEAMSYGIPVVASVVNSGLKEVIESNKYGILIEEHNISFLAEKIEEIFIKNQKQSCNFKLYFAAIRPPFVEP